MISNTIVDILSNSESFKERRLAKQIAKLNEKPTNGRAYLISRKLYVVFLKHIDEESSKKLAAMEKRLWQLTNFFIYFGGWSFNRHGATACENIPYEEKGNDLWHIYRDENGFHTSDKRPVTTYGECVRKEEEHYLKEYKEQFQEAHELMMEKDRILFNREFQVLPGSELLVDEILKALYFDYSLTTPIIKDLEPAGPKLENK